MCCSSTLAKRIYTLLASSHQMDVEGYLTTNEEVRLQWDGQVKSGLTNAIKGSVIFAATNMRLLAITDSGNSKDIEYSHISSVEVETSPKYSSTGTQRDLILGFISLFGGLLILLVAENNAQILLAGIGFILGLGFVVFNWDDFEGFSSLFDFEETTVYNITLITGDEENNQISFQTEENIGAELSRIVRETN